MRTNIKHILAVGAAAILLAGCAKDEAPQGGLQSDGKISAITVTTGGFVSAAPTGKSGGRAAEAPTTGVATVTTEDAGIVYTRAAIGATTANVSGLPGTRATDSDYATEFDDGDQIGLTVVKDGAVLHNNLTLTYNGTAWALPSATELWYFENAEYIAYYPYDGDMSAVIEGATDKTGTGIEAAIFEAFRPKTNQSIYADYTASDLMLWSGTKAGTANDPKLDISLEHAMALVIIEPRGAGYTAPAGADWVYYEGAGYSAPSQVAVTIEGVEYTPYAMLDGGNSTDPIANQGDPDGTYRVLVKPATAAAISGAYETMDLQVAWDNAGATAIDLVAGKYLKYNIATPTSVGIRAPQVGDYFYLAEKAADPTAKDRILPSDLMTEATKPATDAERNRMGVVYWLDPADPAKGKVVSLDEGTSLLWDQTDAGNWSGDYPTNANDAFDGLENMMTVQAYISDNSKDWALNFPAFAWVHTTKNGSTATYSAGATGVWYLPSIAELEYIMCAATGNDPETWGYWTGSGAQSYYPTFNPGGSSSLDLSNLNDKLNAAGGTNLSQTWYWSSTEGSDSNAWVVSFGIGPTTNATKYSQARVRAVLAF